jgi:hypothetical protein
LIKIKWQQTFCGSYAKDMKSLHDCYCTPFMNSQLSSQPLPNDTPNRSLKILSFLCPLAGFLLYFMLLTSSPRQALGARNWAIRGIVFFVVSIILLLVGLWMQGDVYKYWNGADSAPQSTTVARPPQRP